MKKGALIALIIACLLVAMPLSAAVSGQLMEAALGLAPRETKIMVKEEVTVVLDGENVALLAAPNIAEIASNIDGTVADAGSFKAELYSHTKTANMIERRWLAFAKRT